MLGLPVSYITLGLMEGGRLIGHRLLVAGHGLLEGGDGWNSCRGDMGAELLNACLDGYHGGGGVRWLGLGRAACDPEQGNRGGKHRRAKKKEQLDGV